MNDITDVEAKEIKELTISEPNRPLSFSEKYHAEKMMKRSKKKARKELQTKGYTHSEATKLVKQAINRIASKKPMAKSAGRGR